MEIILNFKGVYVSEIFKNFDFSENEKEQYFFNILKQIEKKVSIILLVITKNVPHVLNVNND